MSRMPTRRAGAVPASGLWAALSVTAACFRPVAQDEHRTQTPEGDRFVERILTIRETCRCQDRPMHPYLVDVHTACLTGRPIPTPLTA